MLSRRERVPSCGRPHQGRSTKAATMAHSSKPCKFWEALQALLRRGFCSGPLHLRLAHGSCSCHVSLQMVLPSLSLLWRLAVRTQPVFSVQQTLSDAIYRCTSCNVGPLPLSRYCSVSISLCGHRQCQRTTLQSLARLYDTARRGHSFFTTNEELLDRYAECPGSTEVIAVQTSYLESLHAAPRAVSGAGELHRDIIPVPAPTAASMQHWSKVRGLVVFQGKVARQTAFLSPKPQCCAGCGDTPIYQWKTQLLPRLWRLCRGIR